MEKSEHSFETVWATLDRVGERLDKVGERLDKAGERLDRVGERLDRFGEKMEQSSAKFDREMELSSAKFERDMELSNARFEREMAASRVAFDQRIAETDRMIKNVSNQIGGMANSNGDFAEDFFYNALYHGQRNLFGEIFEEVVKRNKVTINKGFEDEYDILLVNGRAICVVEVKYKADSGDLPHKVLRKAQTFRVNFPHYKDKKLYLALAGMSFHPLTEKACTENGIAIMKQVGDAMVVTDENLKTF